MEFDSCKPANTHALSSSAQEETEDLSVSTFSAILENMLNGVAYCRMLYEDGRPVDFIYLYTNRAFHTQTGIGPVKGKRISEVIPGICESDPQLIDTYGRVASGGAPERFETFVEGLQQWFDVSVFSPTHEYFVAAFDVITERKQAELALLRSQTMLARTESVANVGSWEWQVATDTVTWSDELFRIFQLNPADGAPSFAAQQKLYYPVDLARLNAAAEETINHGTPFELELRVIRQDGETRTCLGRGYSENGPGNKATVLFGSLQDITDRKRAEEKTLEAKQVLEAALSSMSDAVFISNAEGQFIHINDAFASYHRFKSKEEISKSFYDYLELFEGFSLNGEVLPVDRWPVPRALRGEAAVNVEIKVQRKTTGESWIGSYNFAPIFNQEEQVTGSVVTARDITAAKEAEAEIRQLNATLEARVRGRTAELEIANQSLLVAKEAAEEASRAKSTFLANMSHELRTPMNAIMGITGIALSHADDPKLRDQLGKIDNASRHLLAVINDILDISKVEAGRLTLEQGNFTLGEVMANLTSLIGDKAIDNGLQLRIELTPALAHLGLRGDALRLGQILLNITGNAVKFTEAGTITLRAFPTEESSTDVLLRFEIQDTGIGISLEEQQRLFTAFEQADASMTRKFGGTGLGLAISKRLTKLMGGDIGVKSQTGEGSIFWFTVWLGKVPTESNPVPPTPTFPWQTAIERLRDEYAGTRILLAEDEPISQEVSNSLLEEAGLVIDLAEDGEVAVALAKQNHYALVLMDMQMPNLNGVDATLAIRALPDYAEIPIIAMTANAFDEDRQVCIKAGMNDHISKPVDPERLYGTLLQWLLVSSGAETSPAK